jgi:peptide/nickel transport system substrate-binding protein
MLGARARALCARSRRMGGLGAGRGGILLRAALPALLMLLALGGCAARQPYGGTVVLASLQDPEDLNPLYYLDTAAPSVGSLVFNSLVTMSEKLEYVPELAQSWQVSQDGRVWSVSLRKGVRFHDGEELTSRDALFTFDAILDPATGSPLAPHYSMVDHVEVTGPYELRFTLKEPYAPFPYLLFQEIVPAHLLEGSEEMASFGRSPVGSGPFRFESWEPGELTLEANEGYFGGRPYLDRLVVKTYPDRARAWSALMAGEAQVVTDLDPEDYRVLEGDSRFRTYGYLDVFYHTLLLNLKDPLLADPRLREALDLCLDRQDLIQSALEGWAEPVSGPFRPGTWPYDPEVPVTPCDRARAAAIFAELGFHDEDGDLILERQGRELALTILADRGDLVKEAVARRLKWQLLQGGVRAEVELLDPQALFEERLYPGRFQAALLQFNAGADPDKFLSFFWHSSRIGSTNLGSYANPEVDRLIEQGRYTWEPEARKGIYHRIHRLIAADRPALFLYVRRVYFAAAAEIRGIEAAPELFYQSIGDWRIEKP